MKILTPRALFLCLLLSACVEPAVPPSAPSSAPVASSPPLPIEAPVRPMSQTGTRQPALVLGSGDFIGATGEAIGLEIPPGDDIQLSFTNTDIRAVVDTVLGGALGMNYSIDPRVQGQVTIQASRPVPRRDVLTVLDSLLRQQGAALLPMNGFVRIVPLADAGGQSPLSLGGDRQLGFATVVVPVRHVSVDEVRRVLEPVTRQGLILQSDSVRNLFIIGGAPREIESFTEAVKIFDVDWLKGMSFGLYPLHAVEPDKLDQELRRILQLDNGPMHGLVELVPISRLDALLVAAKRPGLLDEVAGWILRLDQPGESGGRMLHFYEVQNGSAAELAGSLSQLTGNASQSNRSGASATRGSVAQPLQGLGGSAASMQAAGAGLAVPVGAAAADTLPPEFRNVRFVADEPRNALIVFATEQQFQTLLPTLERLDSPRDQVLIEATIAEVHLTGDLNYGVQWFLQHGANSGGLASGSSTQLAPSLPGAIYSYSTPSMQVVVSALQAVTDVTVLSAPRVIVLNNQPARLEVGDQVPVITQSAVDVQSGSAPIVNSVEMRDTGVILEVTPRVNRSGVVVLDIVQEVSSVVPTTSSAIDSPTIQQRRINSTVAIHDGETVALGGLISTTRTRSRSGIPWLSTMPVIGALFGATGDSSDREELLLFLHPVVIHSAEQARSITEAMKARVGRLREFIEESDIKPVEMPGKVVDDPR